MTPLCLALRAGWTAGLLACTAVSLAAQQPVSPQVELANLREDVRDLQQTVARLNLAFEQLQNENAQLRAQVQRTGDAVATVAQLNAALADVQQSIRAATAQSKAETLQQVSKQLGELARQTNASLESLAKAVNTRPAAPVAAPSFDENFPREGVPYVVQKGDTLARIAQLTGATVRDIINANKIADPTKIQVGQTLFIPGGKPSAP